MPSSSLELVWLLGDYTDVLLDRIEPDDQEKATSMLDATLQVSTDRGIRPVMERVLSKREIPEDVIVYFRADRYQPTND